MQPVWTSLKMLVCLLKKNYILNGQVFGVLRRVICSVWMHQVTEQKVLHYFCFCWSQDCDALKTCVSRADCKDEWVTRCRNQKWPKSVKIFKKVTQFCPKFAKSRHRTFDLKVPFCKIVQKLFCKTAQSGHTDLPRGQLIKI